MGGGIGEGIGGKWNTNKYSDMVNVLLTKRLTICFDMFINMKQGCGHRKSEKVTFCYKIINFSF